IPLFSPHQQIPDLRRLHPDQVSRHLELWRRSTAIESGEEHRRKNRLSRWPFPYDESHQSRLPPVVHFQVPLFASKRSHRGRLLEICVTIHLTFARTCPRKGKRATATKSRNGPDTMAAADEVQLPSAVLQSAGFKTQQARLRFELNARRSERCKRKLRSRLLMTHMD
ncbi:hypothetical protein GE09DRAFT_1072934, partial [Coniochaeta sp. 2T2.1]